MTDYERDDREEPAGALTTQRRDNQIQRQDFSGGSIQTANGAIEALVAKARANVEAACVMARRWPRNLDNVRSEIMAECRRPALAAVAMYAKPVGAAKDEKGNWVKQYAEGLSIRFAEVAMRCMGNLEASSECIYDDSTVRVIRVLVVDYERNSRWSKDISIGKTVERKQLKKGQRPLGERVNSYGERVFIVEATESDVALKEAAEISKAARTGILRVVPGNLQDEAKAIIREASQKGASDPATARNRMFDAFASIGIKPIALEEWLGHSTDTISPAEVDELRLVHAAIKEGETTWGEALREALDGRDEPAKPKPATKDAAAPKTPDPAPAARSEPAADPAKPVSTPSEKRTSTGKGTAALKGALTGKPAETKPAPVDLPPDVGPPEPGFGYRVCATPDCGVAIEALKSDPPGGVCDTCAAARE